MQGTYTQHCVLGYFQPSLRDWSRHARMAGLFSASAVQKDPIEKGNLDKSNIQPVPSGLDMEVWASSIEWLDRIMEEYARWK